MGLTSSLHSTEKVGPTSLFSPLRLSLSTKTYVSRAIGSSMELPPLQAAKGSLLERVGPNIEDDVKLALKSATKDMWAYGKTPGATAKLGECTVRRPCVILPLWWSTSTGWWRD
jgi:hypothetical protein